MTLLYHLKTQVLDVLAPHGWADLFSAHGLDITVPLDSLETELAQVLKVDRTIAGFEEFTLAGSKGIEGGSPAASLLYHALASPCCAPIGKDGQSLKYPTFEQLDIVENFIYSRSKRQLSDFRDPVLAVFSYQYRDRVRTTHGEHADLAFSRTGIARVGTHPPQYDGAKRSYLINPGIGTSGFRVLPARYALFIAERRPRGAAGTVMRPIDLDSELTFLFPVHKVFPGNECIFKKIDEKTYEGIEVGTISFVEEHVNEKLARIHDKQGNENPFYVPIEGLPFDIQAPPFIRRSSTDPSLLKLELVGTSCQIVPVHGPLVRLATQNIKGEEQIVRFVVPPLKENGNTTRSNRYWSSLELTAPDSGRAAPEYLNIRQEIVIGTKPLRDLNLLPRNEFETKVLKNGGYEAAHFLDNTCDGALTVKSVKGIDLPIFCAYSLVTAVDYFPLVDQVEVEAWIEHRQKISVGLGRTSEIFPAGGPQPMSDGRFQWDAEFNQGTGTYLTYQLPNCNLQHPVQSGYKAFSLADPTNFTVTAIVGQPSQARSLEQSPAPVRTLSWLPDAASDVYAPGWDVSQHQTQNQNMMVSYGLGSPFPEDAKLCAALNSFWPAVAPDSSRTYGMRPKRFDKPAQPTRMLYTSLPLTDGELGYSPGHERVLAGEVSSNFGWDGDYGPYVESVGENQYVNASNPLRADLTRAALDERLHLAGLDCITTKAFIERIEALLKCRFELDRWCFKNLGRPLNHRESGWWLVLFEVVDDWKLWNSKALPRANDELAGKGYIFRFACVGEAEDFESPPLRVRYPVKNWFEVHWDSVKDIMFTRIDGQAFQKFSEA